MSTPRVSILATLRSAFLRLLGGFGLEPSQKWVAHFTATVLSTGVVALLPLEIADSLNGLIIVLAGLVAHYVVPLEKT